MKTWIVILCLLTLSACCGPARQNPIDRAYREGRLTEYEYHQLKIQEKIAREADTANTLRIIYGR